MTVNVMDIMKEISAHSGESMEEVSRRLHAAHFCGWEYLRRTVAEYLARVFLKREPSRAEITATEYTPTSNQIAESIEDAIIGGVIRSF